MSFLVCLASDRPLEKLENPHMKMLSVNEALAIGMELPKAMLMDPELDPDEPGTVLWSDIEPSFDLETGRFECPDPEDNFDIWPIDAADDLQSKREYLAAVEWGRCTPVRAQMLRDYIARHLDCGGEVELWHTWQGSAEEEYPPLVEHREISLAELSAEEIVRLCDTDVLGTYFPKVDVAKQYCLLIKA